MLSRPPCATKTLSFADGRNSARWHDSELPSPWTWAALPSAYGGLLDKALVRWGKRTADYFAEICHERANEAGTGDAWRQAALSPFVGRGRHPMTGHRQLAGAMGG